MLILEACAKVAGIFNHRTSAGTVILERVLVHGLRLKKGARNLRGSFIEHALETIASAPVHPDGSNVVIRDEMGALQDPKLYSALADTVMRNLHLRDRQVVGLELTHDEDGCLCVIACVHPKVFSKSDTRLLADKIVKQALSEFKRTGQTVFEVALKQHPQDAAALTALLFVLRNSSVLPAEMHLEVSLKALKVGTVPPCLRLKLIPTKPAASSTGDYLNDAAFMIRFCNSIKETLKKAPNREVRVSLTRTVKDPVVQRHLGELLLRLQLSHPNLRLEAPKGKPPPYCVAAEQVYTISAKRKITRGLIHKLKRKAQKFPQAVLWIQRDLSDISARERRLLDELCNTTYKMIFSDQCEQDYQSETTASGLIN